MTTNLVNKKENFEITYDKYICNVCNLQFDITNNFKNHMEKKHKNKNPFLYYPQLEKTVDDKNKELEKETNKKYPSKFRIKQKDFIKHKKLKNKELLYKNENYKKINYVGNESINGLKTDLKIKILDYISEININIKHSLLDNFIKIFSIINSHVVNINCIMISYNSDMFIKSIFGAEYSKFDSIIQLKLMGTCKLLYELIELDEAYILKLNKNFDKTEIINMIQKNIEYNDDIYQLSRDNTNIFEFNLIDAIFRFYAQYKYLEFQKFYSESIPLFYNYYLYEEPTKFRNDLYN